jgi:RNA polymerase sigma factor (sigma-70 family)
MQLNKADRDKMVLDNMGLAVVVARRYSRGDDYQDLLQAAIEGLIKAVDRYDPKRPTKFSSMCFPWLKKMVLKTAVERGIVHIPPMKKYRDAKVQKLSNRVYARTGIHIAEGLQYSDSYSELTDSAKPNKANQFDALEEKEYHEFLEEAQYELSSREKKIIKMRLEGMGPKETGEAIGCSKQRANQIYAKAFKKMQKYIVD